MHLQNNMLEGQLQTVQTIAKQRLGKRLAPSTAWRWIKRGVAGGRIRLQALQCGGRWYTTIEAFDQFLSDQTAAAFKEEQKSDSPSQCDDDSLRANGIL
ncbi:DUF1580 domain-containing protein [Thalassoglobus polymorphus]|uniref:Uncharacterized protein n=1 Tax=Thalassoglobus polymorphus TaxID=2527994 RepID=A0A517QKB4_9PLAN|nr:DUF1580 domain-containing protein [Thalassoglobus polymorphus]QDT32065.1 hypothetical protein Mal48_13050 [Thalassoglobus polymorphus]